MNTTPPQSLPVPTMGFDAFIGDLLHFPGALQHEENIYLATALVTRLSVKIRPLDLHESPGWPLCMCDDNMAKLTTEEWKKLYIECLTETIDRLRVAIEAAEKQ